MSCMNCRLPHILPGFTADCFGPEILANMWSYLLSLGPQNKKRPAARWLFYGIFSGAVVNMTLPHHTFKVGEACICLAKTTKFPINAIYKIN